MTRDLYIGDNLPVLQGLNSGTVDFVYLDPPFNSKRAYAAPIASKAAGQRFDDTWHWDALNTAWLGEIDDRNPALGKVIDATRAANGDGTAAYLTMMGIRLLELERILKAGGSIFLHCDDTASHYLKACMDAAFGADAFRNDIVWQRTKGRSDAASRFARVKDNILFYVKSGGGGVNKWNPPMLPHDPAYVDRAYRHEDHLGRWRSADLTAPAHGNTTMPSAQPWRGIDTRKKNLVWRTPTRGGMSDFIIKHNLIEGWPMPDATVHERLDALDEAGLIHWPMRGGMPSLKRYLSSTKGNVVPDLFTDIKRLEAASRETTGWKTQKPVALVERLIEATTRVGDLVLDPFAGCATACIAAERLLRNWIGIDMDPSAEDITLSRLDDETELSSMMRAAKGEGLVRILREPPVRTDLRKETVTARRKRHAQEVKNRLYGEQQGDCNGCGGHYRIKDLEIDHVIPISRGGPDEETNLQLLCGHCNTVKSDGNMEVLQSRLKAQRAVADSKRRQVSMNWNGGC